MKQKVCSNCGETKDATEFHKRLCSTSGLRSQCKKCEKAQAKAYYAVNSEKKKAQNKAWREANPEKKKALGKAWREANPEKKKAAAKAYWAANPEKVFECSRKRRSTPKGRLNNNMSNGIRASLRNGAKAGRHWEALVNFTIDELKAHIEKLFTPGMTWERFMNGEIHIDHIVPIAVHNFTEPTHEDFIKAWSLKNLQPMWAKENMSKGMKLAKPFQPSLLLGAI